MARNTTIINTLVEHVAELRTDVGWMKKFIYVIAASSITAAMETLKHLFTSLIHIK